MLKLCECKSNHLINPNSERVTQWVKTLQMNGGSLVQTPVDTRSGLGIQPRYEASGDLQVET